MCPESYLYSHMGAYKGNEYDQLYQTDPWLIYTCQRTRLTLQRIVTRYYQHRPIKLLDFACGTARITSFLEDKVDEAVGVDVSESMLAVAERKVKRAKLLHANLLKDNLLAGEKFNLITAFRFFLNAEPELRKAAIKAIVPLLADDGLFVFNNHRNQTSPLVRLKYGRRHKTRNFMSMQEMQNMVSEFGLNIIKIYPVGFLPLPRIKLPPAVNNIIDAVASRFQCLRDYSESPIAVCCLA